MKFCSNCGHSVNIEIPDGDNRPRHVCPNCHTIHYQNPRLITGTLPIAPDGRILLCRRNIEPRKNFWTLPAGFMENEETTIEGALRETFEEAAFQPINPELISLISLPQWNQVHLFYKVKMTDFTFSVTEESNAVELFSQSSIPWGDIAFETVSMTLKHYFTCLIEGFSVLNDTVR